MKKLFTILFCAISINAFAQSEHLSFKGVPIDGSLDEYVAKMKDAGFRYLGKQDGTAILTGDFAGFKGCTIGVTTLKSLDVVSMIGVIFTEQDDWSGLSSQYEQLKTMLKQKYGKYDECVEEFQGYSQPSTNTSRLHELKMDRCSWFTIFRTDKGAIELSITHNNMSCFVMLRYYDKINTNAVEEQALNDL